MHIEEQLKQAYLDGSKDCYTSMTKLFHYDEFTSILTFYGIKFTVEAIDAVSDVFSLSDIIKTARTKETLVHIENDYEYVLSIRNNVASVQRKDLLDKPSAPIQALRDGGWVEKK